MWFFSGSVGGLKRRKWYEITFHVVKAMGFECMNECESMHVESWTIKKAERRRIDAFEMWCWRRLESSLDCKEIKLASPRGNQSWIFIGRTDTEAETAILWPPDAKSWLMEKTLMLGKIEGRKKGDDRGQGWMASTTQSTGVWESCRRWWRTGKPGMLQSMESQRIRHNWVTEQQEQPSVRMGKFLYWGKHSTSGQRMPIGIGDNELKNETNQHDLAA